MKDISADAERIIAALQGLPRKWDGKEAIQAMRERDFQWRQMEWIGFYFEMIASDCLREHGFQIPGEKYGRVEFDAFGTINWDLKTKAIRSDEQRVILNDQEAMDASLAAHGQHGIVLALVDVEYNDENRSFQNWHNRLKGGLSDYERDRRRRNAASRYRKTQADLQQILLLAVNASNRDLLNTHRQGRNADGSPRRPKYELDLTDVEQFVVAEIPE